MQVELVREAPPTKSAVCAFGTGGISLSECSYHCDRFDTSSDEHVKSDVRGTLSIDLSEYERSETKTGAAPSVYLGTRA